MQLALTLVSPDPAALEQAASLLALAETPERLGPEALDWSLRGDDPRVLQGQTAAKLAHLPVDVCVQRAHGRKKRLLLADMDSTIINVECLDELADYAGVKAQVAQITDRAMRGELAFEAALRGRVAMLKGLEVSVLQRCYDERVRLNPGARTLATTMSAHGARCMLVSGGFDFFTSRVAKAAGFKRERANRLIVEDGRLTGQVAEPIIGREAKVECLRVESSVMEGGMSASLAVGDGANDLAMIQAAGLGVAYRAKPILSAHADAKVDHSDLTALLYFQGYRASEFAAD